MALRWLQDKNATASEKVSNNGKMLHSNKIRC